jgi:hypothetical protein
MSALDSAFELAATESAEMPILWSTYTTLSPATPGAAQGPGGTWHYVFAAELSTAVDVAIDDFLVPASPDEKFVAARITATGGAWPDALSGSTDAVRVVDATHPLHLSARGPPSPPFACAKSATAYCKHTGDYCDGARRVLAHEGAEDLSGCQAICDKAGMGGCDCFSFAKTRPTPSNCRVYANASALTTSGGGYTAFLKPGAGGAGAAGDSGVTPFEYWVVAPTSASGATVLGDLSKVVPMSKQRFPDRGGADRFSVFGTAGEQVTVHWVPPGGKAVNETLCAFAETGRLVLDCASGACACGTVDTGGEMLRPCRP